jgi:hypothetical protein
MSDSSTNLANRLARHPELHERIETILNIMESTGDELKRADDAERQIIETLRQMGHDALTGWAGQRVERAAEQGQQEPTWRPAGQKNSTGTAPTV